MTIIKKSELENPKLLNFHITCPRCNNGPIFDWIITIFEGSLVEVTCKNPKCGYSWIIEGGKKETYGI